MQALSTKHKQGPTKCSHNCVYFFFTFSFQNIFYKLDVTIN